MENGKWKIKKGKEGEEMGKRWGREAVCCIRFAVHGIRYTDFWYYSKKIKGLTIRYDIIEKIGEGNRGEVYKAKLEDGRIVAIKWAKNYEIDKEWEILKFLNGLTAPKPIFRGKRYFIMEYIDGKPLKDFVGYEEYYNILKDALYNAYLLDEKGIFHGQLGRYYHILKTEKQVKFIDFERGVLVKILEILCKL